MADDRLHSSIGRDLTARNAALAHDPSLVDPVSFAARDDLSQEIERLDNLIADSHPGQQRRLWGLRQEALRARNLLDEAHKHFFAVYRRQIRENLLTPSEFRALLQRYTLPGPAEAWSDPPRYDLLDTLVDGLLQIDVPPQTQLPVEPEMIPYQATPARIVLDMADRLALSSDDVLYDLGAGLGRVVFILALASAGHMKGVEVEPAFVDDARRRARELNLARVSFINADAREVDYADGTVFFLYTPFKGTILRRVLALLRDQARRRRIRVCTYGPGTLEIQDQDWLTSDDDPEHDVHYVTIFESTQAPRRTVALRRRRRRA